MYQNANKAVLFLYTAFFHPTSRNEPRKLTVKQRTDRRTFLVQYYKIQKNDHLVRLNSHSLQRPGIEFCLHQQGPAFINAHR